ncbi:MAG: hydrolase [Candidatus Saccharibacteria bacterium]|nr:hydrolase [Candidatus Saccharibacteria bacterium]
MKKSLFSTADYYKPYAYKGLCGRYIYMPAKSAEAKRTFVVLYGQHATLERIEPIVSALTKFGDVYAVDYPGFGGMDPAYKIGEQPTLSFYSGHINQFIKEIIPADKTLTLLGISYGFQLVTETLHSFPELQQKVEDAISFVGFVHHNDFHLPPSYSIPMLYLLALPAKTWLGSRILTFLERDWLVSGIYMITKPIQAKFKSLSKAEAKSYMDEQAWLWRINDLRTHAVTALAFCKHNDLTAYRIKVPVTHIGVPKDHLVDNTRVAVELKEMFSSFQEFSLNLAIHAPLDLGSPESVLELLPPDLLNYLESSAATRTKL